MNRACEKNNESTIKVLQLDRDKSFLFVAKEILQLFGAEAPGDQMEKRKCKLSLVMIIPELSRGK